MRQEGIAIAIFQDIQLIKKVSVCGFTSLLSGIEEYDIEEAGPRGGWVNPWGNCYTTYCET